jgi:hypothetical protein
VVETSEPPGGIVVVCAVAAAGAPIAAATIKAAMRREAGTIRTVLQDSGGAPAARAALASRRC